jgi:hypothetical protein
LLTTTEFVIILLALNIIINVLLKLNIYGAEPWSLLFTPQLSIGKVTFLVSKKDVFG